MDKDKVILMTKLAMYDKSSGKRDRRILQYFRHDYVYRQNMWTRFNVFISALFALLFYVLHKLTYEGIDLFELNYQEEAVRLLLFYVLTAGAFTVIGTLKATAEYDSAYRRMELYVTLLNKLDAGSYSEIYEDATDAEGRTAARGGSRRTKNATTPIKVLSPQQSVAKVLARNGLEKETNHATDFQDS